MQRVFKFGRVGDKQHHGMRLHHVGPPDFLVAKKLIGRYGLCQVVACTRNAHGRLCREPLQQFPGTSVSPWITQVQRCKFLAYPYR